jgi:nitrite reductase/ring-hydroxylating ferredoxin subunit
VSGGRFPVCKADELAPGERLVVDLGGRSVGVSNVGGSFYALHNRCPHRARGPLCLGPITGLSGRPRTSVYSYGEEGRVLRCAWHGWEFEIETGRAVADPKLRAKSFPVTLADGEVVIHI